MAIDYEFRNRIDKEFREVSGLLHTYFTKNPDRARENPEFIERIKENLTYGLRKLNNCYDN